MTATLAIYRLRDEFNIDLPLMLIFEHSTVGELADAIDEMLADEEGAHGPEHSGKASAADQ